VLAPFFLCIAYLATRFALLTRLKAPAARLIAKGMSSKGSDTIKLKAIWVIPKTDSTAFSNGSGEEFQGNHVGALGICFPPFYWILFFG